MNGVVLLVDDEVMLVRHLQHLLRHEGFETVAAHTAAEAVRRMREAVPDVVLMDLRLPDADGSELMVKLRAEYPESRFIIITAHGSIRSAVENTRLGASDYLVKPFEPEEMLLAVRNALSGKALVDEVRHLRRAVSAGSGADDSPGAYPSAAMRELMRAATQAAEQRSIVLLLGESGTGKDHLARWIHRQSSRADGPFFAINCGALPRELAESELFGHEPGAFTGAQKRKRGLLELAERGTLLLNEVGELDGPLQSKLLTFLDTRKFVRVGGEREIGVDARILAATNRDLAEDVERGRFRRDLYYRLNVLPIRVPALRERKADIPVLARQILGRMALEMGLAREVRLSPGTVEKLVAYDWPGNVRELRNVLERGLIATPAGGSLRVDLDLEPQAAGWRLEIDFPEGPSLHEVLAQVARDLLAEAIRRGGSKRGAAELLGLTRHAFAYQAKMAGLEEGSDGGPVEPRREIHAPRRHDRANPTRVRGRRPILPATMRESRATRHSGPAPRLDDGRVDSAEVTEK